MRRSCVYILLLCAFLSGCSNKKVSDGVDSTSVFSNTLKSSKITMSKIRGFENTILRLYLEHSVPTLEQNFLGIEPDSFEDTDFTPEGLEMEGIYNSSYNFSIYSRTEASTIFDKLRFNSDNIEKYSESDIGKYNEIAKALITITVTYGIDTTNNYITQSFVIEDIKTEKYFIFLKWKGDECVEISYKDFSYLW